MIAVVSVSSTAMFPPISPRPPSGVNLIFPLLAMSTFFHGFIVASFTRKFSSSDALIVSFTVVTFFLLFLFFPPPRFWLGLLPECCFLFGLCLLPWPSAFWFLFGFG